jgi:hypothetical protein
MTLKELLGSRDGLSQFQQKFVTFWLGRNNGNFRNCLYINLWQLAMLLGDDMRSEFGQGQSFWGDMTTRKF